MSEELNTIWRGREEVAAGGAVDEWLRSPLKHVGRSRWNSPKEGAELG
jgi:hypothetical protein